MEKRKKRKQKNMRAVSKYSRKDPYLEKGLERASCFRCGATPCYSQWQICADNNSYRPICKECDILLNELVLRWMEDPLWEEKIREYERRLENE